MGVLYKRLSELFLAAVAAGAHLWGLARGIDPTPVTPSGPPKSITVEDSFKSCSSWEGVGRVLEVLLPDLIARLEEEWQENGRW